MARGDGPGSRPSGPVRDDALRTAVTALASAAGFDVEDVTVRLSGGRRLIRVVVDRDSGVDLDTAASLSRDIAAALDADYDAVVGDAAYTLEVTSRGVGAPLTAPRHFRRAVGRMVTVVRADGSSLTARIARTDGSNLLVLAGPGGDEPMTIPLGDVTSATVQVEFAPPSERVTRALASVRERSGRDGSPRLGPLGDDAEDVSGIEGDDAR